MSKDPAFLFYSDNFMTGTMFFTDEQVGKYIRLLCAQHLHGHLSKKHMLTICNSHDKDIFNKFILDSDGLYYNKRLDEEINKRKNFTESRRTNALGKKKKTKASAKHMLQHMGNGNGDINIYKNKNKRIVNEFFESIWKLYPRKKGKGQISDAQKKKLHLIGYEILSMCIDRFCKDHIGKDEKFIMYGSTFFNSGYVDYLDSNYDDKTEPKLKIKGTDPLGNPIYGD